MIRLAVLLATFYAGCLGIDGTQPAAPQNDEVPAEQGGGAEPVFGARKALDAGSIPRVAGGGR